MGNNKCSPSKKKGKSFPARSWFLCSTSSPVSFSSASASKKVDSFMKSSWSWFSLSPSSSSPSQPVVKPEPAQVTFYVSENEQDFDDQNFKVFEGKDGEKEVKDDEKVESVEENFETKIRPQEAIFWIADNKTAFFNPIAFSNDIEGTQRPPKPKTENTITTNTWLRAIENDFLPRMLFDAQVFDRMLAISEFDDDDDDEGVQTPKTAPKEEVTSAFVMVMLSSEMSPQFQTNGGFLSLRKTGQVLKVRLSDGALFLSNFPIHPTSKGKTYFERPVELKLKEERSVVAETEFSEVTGKPIVYPSPKYSAITIKRPSQVEHESGHSEHASCSLCPCQWEGLEVDCVKVSLGDLLQEGIVFISYASSRSIIFNLAPLLAPEKDLPMPFFRRKKCVKFCGKLEPISEEEEDYVN